MTIKVVTVQITHHHLEHGITALEMKGSIHAGPDCKRIEDDVEALIQGRHTRLVFDLTGVTHIDSAAIGMIVKCFSRVKKSGGILHIAGATGMVDGTLKLTQVHKVIGTYPNVSSAAAAFPTS